MMTRADVVLADGRRIEKRHVMEVVKNRIAITSFGTFEWRDNAWRWVADETITLDLPAP